VGTLSCAYGEAPDATEEARTSPSTDPTERAGTLSFALSLEGGSKFSAFSYVITGPDFTKAGSIDVSESNTVSAQLEGIPAGAGYSLNLQGRSTAPSEAECSGSASFAISGGEVTTVPVAIACHVTDVPSLPAPVPLPPSVAVALGVLLLALGSTRPRTH
jgi:hypothetical protein